MQRYNVILLLIFLSKIFSCPYCAIRCGREKNIKNGFCSLFEQMSDPRPAVRKLIDYRLDRYIFINLTDEHRHAIILYINGKRNELALGKGWFSNKTTTGTTERTLPPDTIKTLPTLPPDDGETIKPDSTTTTETPTTEYEPPRRKYSNMRYINYDMELEYLANVAVQTGQRRFEKEINTACLKSAYYHVNFIRAGYGGKDPWERIFEGPLIRDIPDMLDRVTSPKTDDVSNFTNDELLFYAAKVDHVGCSLGINRQSLAVRNQTYIPRFEYDAIWDFVCMFGSKDTILIPIRETLQSTFLGQPCRECFPEVGVGVGCNDHFKGLCGTQEHYNFVHKRWDTEFWANPELEEEEDPTQDKPKQEAKVKKPRVTIYIGESGSSSRSKSFLMYLIIVVIYFVK